jgi:hypothetical protein
MFTYTKLHMATIECKLAMCFSRLVEFELLLELTGLQLRLHICGLKKGSFFKGAYFPQKLAQKTSIETRYKFFQAHVLSY